jgi:hypothetical protein
MTHTELGMILTQCGIASMVQPILNGIITNDKFCLSRMKQLPKRAAKGGFPQERQYPSEAIEEIDCPKVEKHEKTTVERSTLHD